MRGEELDQADILRATTSVPAGVMGYGSELGAIRPGNAGRPPAFGGNPLQDISAARAVRGVVANGDIYSMADLMERPGGE
jgi:imidazolonepropionase-like amidohydrolase